jgi:hypothetical protein
MSVLRIPKGAQLDSNFMEGIVSSVDIERMFCQVKTNKGQNISSVTWLLSSGGADRGGSHEGPSLGDRVMITAALGYPVIIGFLPKREDGEAFPQPLDSGVNPNDTGNLSPIRSGSVTNIGKPGDMVIGDSITSSKGGGLFGMLRGGSVIIKASRLAQIFVCKLDDLVRIVGRNYEVFTDLSSKVHVSIRGRVYGFFGASDTLTNSRLGKYKYKEFLGDTALAEHLEDNYHNANPATFPVANTIIKKEIILDDSNNQLLIQTVDMSGEDKKIIQNAGGANIATIDHSPALISTTTASGGAIGAVTVSPSTVVVSATNGTLSSATFTSSSATITYNNSATIVANASGINCAFGGHFVTIDSSGVHLG